MALENTPANDIETGVDLSTNTTFTPDYSQVPSYQLAADSHNVASGNGSWLSSVGSTIQNITTSFENAPKFWALAAGSGITGILNSGIAIGNLFSSSPEAKTAQINYGKWVQDYDSDLGKYYADNADSIDTAGFVVTSLVPGTLGVKAFNLGAKAITTAAEAGVFGKNIAAATGLISDGAAGYVSRAAVDIAASNQAISYFSSNALKAIAVRTGQQALEAAAFEGAVVATSFKSPFFNDMDSWDMVKNAAIGTLLGGGIGGVIGTFGVRSAIKNEVIELDKIGKTALYQSAASSSLPDGIQLANHFQNRNAFESFIESVDQNSANAITRNNISNAKNSIQDVNNKIRTQIRGMTVDSDAAGTGNYFADVITGLGYQDGTNATLGAESFMRAANIKNPKATLMEKAQTQLAGIPEVEDSQNIQWTKLYGANRGAVQESLPDALPLADVVKTRSGQSLQDAVNAQIKNKVKGINNPLDALDAPLRQTQARFLWATKESTDFKPAAKIQININDIPLMEAVYRQQSKFDNIEFVNAKGNVVTTVAGGDTLAFTNQLQNAKMNAVERLMKRKGMTIEEVAERTNVNPGFIDQTAVSNNWAENFMHRQSIANELKLSKPEELFYKPQYMGIKQSKDVDGLKNQFQIDGHLNIESYNRAAQGVVDNAVADAGSIYQQQTFFAPNGKSTVGNYTEILPPADTITNLVKTSANRGGAGSRLFTFANGNYMDLESAMQYVGQIKARMDIDGMNSVTERLNPILQSIRNNTAAATEWSVTRELVARSGEQYVMRDGNLVARKIAQWEEAGGEGAKPMLNAGAKEVIQFQYPEARALWQEHINLNGQRIQGRNSLRAAQGLEQTLDPETAYAIKPNPKQFQHFAFVVDDTLTGAGKTTMIHARDAKTLDAMRARIQREFPQFKIITKSDSESYHKALGDYNFDRTLHENYIDSSLASRGINSQFLPRTDANSIADEVLDWHKTQVRSYNADIISTKYERAFRELDDLGRDYASLSGSRYASYDQLATDTRRNPYAEYKKVALNISNISEYPLLVNINQTLDNVVSGLWNRAQAMFQTAKSPEDLEAINSVFQNQGFKTAYYDAATDLLANHPADSAVLSKFIRGANSLLATTFLRLDVLNAINNKLGSVILTSTELRHVVSQIEKGNEAAVGKLAAIAKVKVPTGDETDTILSPPKLIMRALQNFSEDVLGGKNVLANRYKQAGWMQDSLADAQKMMDNLTLNGTETTKEVSNKLTKAFEAAKSLGNLGEKWTGNKLVEQMNRFMAADIMRQITDVGVEAGIISKSEANIYINTFVNRTQVNLNSAQRPLAFQGPIGMAIGLFQSYQFNLMQQAFRYIAPGARRDGAMLLGMQGSIYGMNGLPGFQQFNEHIIGQAYGNHEHNDIYSKIYGNGNYDLANFLLYGLPSNLLRTNLYSRGDITPQHPTILPGSISEIPFVGKFSQFLGNLKQVGSDIAAGAGIWNSVLSGLEHNSINRPLAGIAQTLRAFGDGSGKVYSTSSHGDLLSANDLFSLTTLSRLAGGRPLDESIARDNMYRMQAYQKADTLKRADMQDTLTRAFNGGYGNPDVDKFFTDYLASGGKQAGFNRWMMKAYVNSNTSQTEQMKMNLSSPYSQKLQAIMSGDFEDSLGRL